MGLTDGGQAPGAGRTSGSRSASNELHVRHEGRKPLFGGNKSSTLRDDSSRAGESPRLASRFAVGPTTRQPLNAERRTNSEPQTSRERRDSNSNASVSSSGGTRIPRPSSATFRQRRPLSLSEAFRLAEDEERAAQGVDGSPSPAPRTWRAKSGQDEVKQREQLGHDHLDTKARSKQSEKPTSSLYSRERFEELKSRARQGLGAATGPDSSDSLNIPALVPGIEDVPIRSIETDDRPAGRSPLRSAKNRSPHKSFGWGDFDEDFTGGDLQISDSPRIKVGSNKPFAHRPSLISSEEKLAIRSPTRLTQPGSHNTKLDEIRDRERELTSKVLAEGPQPRQRNSHLDEIRAREKLAEQQIPVPNRNLPRPKNTKLDDIRQRENEGLSRKAWAAARLEEIREQNSMSRSLSPEEARPQSSGEVQAKTPGRIATRSKSTYEGGGERIPDTPVTVYKNQRTTGLVARAEPSTAAGGGPATENPDKNSDSYDWLRRLARATSESPLPEAEGKQKAERKPEQPRSEQDTADDRLPKPVPSRRPSSDERKPALSTTTNGRNDNPRLTVGFAGIPREQSSDSAKSKRSSLHSDQDPTDRYDSEMKLFAPHDNHSERGSVRAPSPPPESDVEDKVTEATPKPPRPDPLTMPTPKVTGAYVETPATMKVDRLPEDATIPNAAGGKVQPLAIFGDKKAGIARRSQDYDSASDPGVGDKRDSEATTTKRRPRSRSLPRRRPPLKNSAKPPSVRDDLLELQRMHNIDDSTMDDLEDILTGRKAASPKLEQILKEIPPSADKPTVKRESTEEVAPPSKKVSSDEDEAEGESALFDRLTQRLRTGLLGIRSAKMGIERLEDRFTHAEKRSSSPGPDATKTQAVTQPTKGNMYTKPAKHDEQCPDCLAKPGPEASYIHLPIPRLYTTTPQFRFTLIGLVLFILSIWYAAESAMCARYCRPTSCSPSKPCIFSYDDPTFGSALPVKLDQWTTGGHGRELVAWAAEELGDWAADVEDALRGRHITDVPLQGMPTEQRRRHRRRLLKKGFLRPPPDPTPEQQATWDSWRQTRLARERAEEAREMGYEVAADEFEYAAAVGDDQPAWD
ncbi:hypothetical protein JDV02_009654 [Purpureocillium takamizusanense]|uniref:Uncharacterized protein n=1 Tax=Purpureocillium takamizusanense TaxID=2060973 RepID=A0A9Q8QRA3_9HYPO|nr:uncharacterized protein JDV02_009654 [Purpureocillium takamizusanense]UNI23861.1 hypothetical protein JDV02_009654 [Purpureocillium takamizusanense]